MYIHIQLTQPKTPEPPEGEVFLEIPTARSPKKKPNIVLLLFYVHAHKK